LWLRLVSLGTWLQERPEIMAAIAVFVPPYLIVIAGAPYYRRLTKKLASEGVRSGRDGGSGGGDCGSCANSWQAFVN
jgi:hypothetical protein